MIVSSPFFPSENEEFTKADFIGIKKKETKARKNVDPSSPGEKFTFSLGKFGEGEVSSQSQLYVLVRTGSGNWVWWNDPWTRSAREIMSLGVAPVNAG